VTGLPIDPRIRQRRIQVTREEGRRRLRIVATSVAVAAVVAGSVGATRSPLLDVDRVEVVGARHTPQREVVAASGLADHPLMLDVDPAAVARAVESLPWVGRATAERRWPGTVRIEITERVPAAAVATGQGGWARVDRTGRVLALEPGRPADLPVIANLTAPGRPGQSLVRTAAGALRVAASLPPELRPRVAELLPRPDGDVDLGLRPPGGMVRLGPPRRLDAELAAAVAVLTRADVSRLAVVDVRVPTSPVLTRR
jgi:cell division protein FtsQ